MSEMDEQLEELLVRAGIDKKLAELDPRELLDLLEGWAEDQGFRSPGDAMAKLSVGEVLKEAAAAVFWYSYGFIGEHPPDKFVQDFERGRQEGPGGNPPRADRVPRHIGICYDAVEYREGFLLEDIKYPRSADRLSVKAYVRLLAAAAKIILMLNKSAIFNADIVELLEEAYLALGAGEIPELRDYQFTYDGHTIKGDVPGFSACVASGIVCNSYAHHKAARNDCVTAFIANARAARYLERAAACLGSVYVTRFSLPCCENGFDCEEIRATVKMWEEVKRRPDKVEDWQEMKALLESMDRINWDMCSEFELVDARRGGLPAEGYFTPQQTFCDDQIEWREWRNSIEDRRTHRSAERLRRDFFRDTWENLKPKVRQLLVSAESEYEKAEERGSSYDSVVTDYWQAMEIELRDTLFRPAELVVKGMLRNPDLKKSLDLKSRTVQKLQLREMSLLLDAAMNRQSDEARQLETRINELMITPLARDVFYDVFFREDFTQFLKKLADTRNDFVHDDRSQIAHEVYGLRSRVLGIGCLGYLPALADLKRTIHGSRLKGDSR